MARWIGRGRGRQLVRDEGSEPAPALPQPTAPPDVPAQAEPGPVVVRRDATVCDPDGRGAQSTQAPPDWPGVASSERPDR